MSTAKSARIAIIGGGPGGLVLLNVLARHGVSATLYERDTQLGSRAHLGGSLDLHEDSGQAAIKGAGLWDAFTKHSRPEGEEMILVNKVGETLFHHAPPPNPSKPGRPEIDRSMLRQILVEGAPEGSIQWDHAFVSATPVVGTSQWEISFSNGRTEVVDLVVGADGARSRVRPLVSDAQIAYTGLTGAEVTVEPDTVAAHPDLQARIGHGSVFAVGDGKMFGTQRNDGGRLRTYAWFRADEKDASTLPDEPAAAKAHILSHYEGWAPWLRQLVELAEDTAIYPRPVYKLPVGHSWPHRAGVTLLGDAMNLMTPFGGKGANIAMYAALQLGLAIVHTRDGTVEDREAAITEYEQSVRAVAAKAAGMCESYMNMALGPNAVEDMLKVCAATFGTKAQ
ncbi:monooxygenase [Exidia glandulosa HHB12029]|uniref:Monooxygenase n=1 Tax=Exidia glandulosa HHB12029 TaxID=1314781 RepID=A0A165G6V8_EXIGL|nr:monooxygenase [Exidia glandulosa HHB12029]